jgi:hypothetical protein
MGGLLFLRAGGAGKTLKTEDYQKTITSPKASSWLPQD